MKVRATSPKPENDATAYCIKHNTGRTVLKTAAEFFRPPPVAGKTKRGLKPRKNQKFRIVDGPTREPQLTGFYQLIRQALLCRYSFLSEAVFSSIISLTETALPSGYSRVSQPCDILSGNGILLRFSTSPSN